MEIDYIIHQIEIPDVTIISMELYGYTFHYDS
jgi:hypothetical protein